MNKLQKLLESGIEFTPCFDSSSEPKTFLEAIDDLWEEAKKKYPDADCFREEREKDE